MTTRSTHRPVWTWLCSASSLALLFVLLAMAVHIRLTLGRWPTFGEDPGTFLFRTHELLLVGVGLFALYAALPIWIVLLFWRPFRLPLTKHVVQALLFAAGWMLIF